MKADVVVVGAGALGLSTALHCSLRNYSVVVVERDSVGSQASGRAAALFKSIQPDRVRTGLALRSIEKVLGFAEWAGVDLNVKTVGSYTLALSPEYKNALRLEAEQARTWGVNLSEVDPAMVSEAAPYYHRNGSEFAVSCPGDIYLNEPSDLLDAYVAACQNNGVEFLEGEGATSIFCSNNEVIGLETSKRRIDTKNVVNAAGAWSRSLGERFGATVATVPVRHQLFITEKTPEVEDGSAIVRVHDNAIYLRPARGGLMLGGLEKNPLPLDPRLESKEFRTENVPLDVGVLRELASATANEVPVAVTAPVASHRAGLFTMTLDGRHLVGPMPGVSGLWTASGCNGSGFSLSPGLGEALAELITGGKPIDGFDALSPSRTENTISSSLTEKGVWHYAHYYELDR